MGENIVYDAYLEIYADGSCLAQLLDLQGCYARGASEPEALAGLTARISAYYAWLSRHDEYTPAVHGPFQVVVAERVRVNTPAHGTRSAFFAPDFEPVTDDDLDWALALLEWAYEDLYARIATAVAAGGEPAQHAHAIAQRVATHQLWLLSRLGGDAPPAPTEAVAEGPLDRLRHIARLSHERLRACSEREREQTLRVTGELWSLRKVLRRSVLNVRVHDDELARTPGE